MNDTDETFVMRPIGTVRSPYRDTAQVPRGKGAEHHAEGVLEIVPALEAGLTDIEGFSHLYVLWVFDRAEGYSLQSTPPTDTPPHGVFATRSPRRANPIGFTVLHLLRRAGRTLAVRRGGLGGRTRTLCSQPYLSSIPQEELRRGWLGEVS